MLDLQYQLQPSMNTVFKLVKKPKGRDEKHVSSFEFDSCILPESAKQLTMVILKCASVMIQIFTVLWVFEKNASQAVGSRYCLYVQHLGLLLHFLLPSGSPPFLFSIADSEVAKA